MRNISSGKSYIRNVILFGLFAAWSTNCSAGSWYLLEASDDSFFYIDKSTVRNDKNILRVWELIDTTNGFVDNQKIKSYKEHREYDCNKETHRTVYVVHYSDNMGGGNVLHSISTIYDPFNPIVPGSVTETIFNYLCR